MSSDNKQVNKMFSQCKKSWVSVWAFFLSPLPTNIILCQLDLYPLDSTIEQIWFFTCLQNTYKSYPKKFSSQTSSFKKVNTSSVNIRTLQDVAFPRD